MENQRSLLLIAFLAVSFYVWQSWQADKLAANQPTTAQAIATSTDAIPSASATADDGIPEQQESSVPIANSSNAATIDVVTDSLMVTIDLNGGDLVHAALPAFTLDVKNSDPVVLLQRDNNFRYEAQSGLTGLDRKDWRPTYSANSNRFVLADGQQKLDVSLTYQGDNGLAVTKTLTFHRGSHVVDVRYEVNNNGSAPIAMRLWGMLRQSAEGGHDGSFFMPTFRGAAYSTADKRYEKLSFDDLAKEKPLAETTQGGWVAMLQHYFVSAWVPAAGEQNDLYSGASNGMGRIGFMGPSREVATGETANFSAQLFIGPKDQKALSALSPSLNLVVDYGILWFIAVPLHWLLTLFHSLVGNWGVAIILITLTVKGALYRLTKAQYSSMAKMRLLQPKLVALKERFGDDRQKLSQAMMELYKKEKVNPLGGCLPILLQMPIFIALYWVLMESVELRQAPFMLWIQDLSVKDPYFVLPLLMGASMWAMQKMSPMNVTDPMQQKMMQWMPIVFTAFFLMFPSGLVLYWLFSNLVSMTQQWLINRSMEKQGLKAAS